MQGHDAGYGRSKSGRDCRISHIGNVPYSLHLEVMDFSVEGLAYLAGRSRKINEQIVRVINIDLETMRFEPVLYCVAVLLSHSKPLSELVRREPVMKNGRGRVMELFNEFTQLPLLLGGTL